MPEKIQLIELADGSLTEDVADVAWVRDGYTEPREFLETCVVCEQEIEDWYLMTCLDGGEAAHNSCVEITKEVMTDERKEDEGQGREDGGQGAGRADPRGDVCSTPEERRAGS